MNTDSPTPTTPIPCEAECLRQGNDYFYGMNDCGIDYEKHAEWMQRGHALGYLNCTAELCDCYAAGYGVARDYARALELAHEMVDKGFPLGWKHLALAHGEGHGVPLDKAKARDYAQRLIQALEKPVCGVDEELRREALLMIYGMLNSVMNTDGAYTEAYMNLARENLLESQLPDRYALYASALLHRQADQDEETPEVDDIQEVVAYLEKGVALHDGVSLYLMSVVQRMLDDPDGRVPGLLQEAAASLQSVVWGDILSFCPMPDEEMERYVAAFWFSCNHGVSMLEREGALLCHIRLRHSPCSLEWNVCSDPNGRDISPLSASLQLCNGGKETLSGLSLRLCSSDAGVDFHTELAESIAPGSVLELSLAEYEQKAGKDFGREFYVEVSSGGRSAEMALDHTEGLHFFHHKAAVDAVATLQLWWERSRWGGVVLCACSTKGELQDFTVARRRNGRVSAGHTLHEGEVMRFGRWAFKSCRALVPGEEFAVYAEGMPMLWVQLCA